MMTMSWTVPIEDALDPAASPIDRGRLWSSLLAKAEAPTGYVPAITQCRIVERYDDGFLREIVRNGEKLVQRVRPEPERRIVFEHMGDPDVASITNIVGTDNAGRTTFTIETAFTAAGSERAARDGEFLRSTAEYFTATIDAIVGVLRTMAAAAPH
ncbi:AtaL-like protein [Micromonospora sp. SCSIO 07396]